MNVKRRIVALLYMTQGPTSAPMGLLSPCVIDSIERKVFMSDVLAVSV